MTRRIMTLSLFLLLALGMLAAPLQAKPASSGLDADVLRELAEVRRATAQYHDVAVAEAAGYTLMSECVAHPEWGGMGYHYVNMELVGTLNPTTPPILVYAPRPNGSLTLVAVEYAVPAAMGPASLFGQTFEPIGPPGLLTLHVWVWRANPDGMFAPYNPNVSC